MKEREKGIAVRQALTNALKESNVILKNWNVLQNLLNAILR